MTPTQSLKILNKVAKELGKARKMSVDVGVISDKLTKLVYQRKLKGKTKEGKARFSNPVSVLEVAAKHEFGEGIIPQRSFLRMPFELKKGILDSGIKQQFGLLLNGKLTAEKALGRVGALATNISKTAFVTSGYGQWKELSKETVKRKGSSRILIETRTLSRSITWQVKKGK